MRVGSGGVLALGVALATLGGLLLIADTAQAVGEEVRVMPNFQDVLEGWSSRLEVVFGTGDTQEEVRVDCRQGGCGGPFTRTVTFDEDKDNCGRKNGTSKRFCRISFPEGFTSPDGRDAGALGEPSRRQPYDVRVGTGVGEEATDTFEVWMTTAGSCRDQEAWRHDILRVTTTGHPAGQKVHIRIIDLDRSVTVLERTRVSSGPGVMITELWEIPLDYPLGGDGEQKIRVEVDGGSTTDVETFPLLPASPVPNILLNLRPVEPGQPADPDFNRTEEVRFYFRMFYLAAPDGCKQMSPFRKVTPLEGSAVPRDTLRVLVEKVDTATSIESERSETVASPRAVYVEPLNQFWVNHTIAKDAEATRGGAGTTQDNPLYKITVDDQDLADGNRIRAFSSALYRVHPYTIEPRIELLPREVERLESADLSFNLTYADGSPFTPNDTDERILAELRQVGADEPKEVNELEYTGDGLWNTTEPINMTFEPVGEYRWILRAAEDKHGDPNHRNEIPRTPTPIFDIVVARPLLDLKTYVGSEEVNGTERTRTVHVTLHAEYKDGRPLTSENVDPSLGGVMLKVKKTNQFGRILDVDSLLMTDADDAGGWVRTFRIPKTASGAPAGTWDLEVIAGDDRDPSNKNVTAFPFEVEPARINVRPVVPPPDLVDGEELRYVTRLTYPDGSLFTEEMANPQRGGEIQVDLVRLNFLDEPRTEISQRPTGIQGGQQWEFQMDTDKAIPGPHFFNVTGQDIHGNIVGPHSSKIFTIMFEGEFRNSTSPICPGNASIAANESQCGLQRGSEIVALFPSSPGDQGIFTEEPVINVLRRPVDANAWQLYRQDASISHDQFQTLTDQEAGQNHVGYFKTDASTPSGTYMFIIVGRDGQGVGFVGFSVKFNVTPIEVQREVVQPPPDTTEKGEKITAILARQPGDVVDEAVVRAGPVTYRNVEVTPAAGVGTFVQWTPPRNAPSGPFVIEVDGRDVFGNPFHVSLGPTELAPAEITTSVVEDPPVEAKRLKLVRLETKLSFADGQAYTSRHGTPQVRILDEDGRAVDNGVARFFDGRWFMGWSPPGDLPLGSYRFEIGGRDSAGNVIDTFTSKPFQVVPGTVEADTIDSPDAVTRGETAEAEFTFPTEIKNLTSTLTTGTTGIGEARVSFNGSTARVSFPTDRTTELVLVRFHLDGEDIHGNEIDDDSHVFQINPQRLFVRFLNQPPDNVQKNQKVVVDFVVLYPDGTRMRPGQGTPVAGLFARDQPLGPIRPEPRKNDPTVWRITWEPPGDVRTELPYRFAVSALDRWQNEAPPGQTQGFFIVNPVVPDYLPVPAVNPVAILAMLGAAAALLGRDRWRGNDPPP